MDIGSWKIHQNFRKLRKRKFRGYCYVVIGTNDCKIPEKFKKPKIVRLVVCNDWVYANGHKNLHIVVHMDLKDLLHLLSCEWGRKGHITFKKWSYFNTPQTLSTYADFQQKFFLDILIKLLNFGYYIKTENYEVFIPKIAREVYNLEHQKLQKRKLRGRKLRGHSVPQKLYKNIFHWTKILLYC